MSNGSWTPVFGGRAWLLSWLLLSLVGGFRPALSQTVNSAAILEAVKASDITRLRKLTPQHLDVNVSEPDGTTSLHYATHSDSIAIMRVLIDAQADVNARNRYGVAPLLLAAENGSANALRELLSAGANVNTALPNGETALMVASRSGHADAVRVLLDAGADPNAAEGVRGQTALMWAAAEGHADVVELLGQYGADITRHSSIEEAPNTTPQSPSQPDLTGGLTALMFAVRAGDLATTRVLFDAGADITDVAPDRTGILVLAILNARYELASYLLEQGADPNAADPRGSPLHVLAWARGADNHGLSNVLPRVPTGKIDSLSLAEELLQYGADPNTRITWDEPASNPERSRRAKLPKDLALGPTELSFEGATPFWISARYADSVMMRLLYDYGADPQIPTRQNVTPFDGRRRILLLGG